MELAKHSKYDSVRRLTNSDSLVSNPYFPSKWKIYWWNNLSWEEFNKVNILSSLYFFYYLFCTFHIPYHPCPI